MLVSLLGWLHTFSQIYLFITAVVSAAGPGSGSGAAEVQVLSSDAIVTSSGSPLRLLWSPESVFLFVVVVCFS